MITPLNIKNPSNYWLEKHKTNMSLRHSTYELAFKLLELLPNHFIVETGCVRGENDWGAGCSTVLFGEFCSLYGGKLLTVDINPDNISTAKRLTERYKSHITYICADSISLLRMVSDEIDLLYLDSMDVPLGDGVDRTSCQQHCLNEFKAAESRLHDRSIVLIDDYFDGNGKGRLLEKYLVEKGWNCVAVFQQQLFLKYKL